MTPEQLKASILQYAIQGKLVEQLPSDESADILRHNLIEKKQNLVKKGISKKSKTLVPITDDEKLFEIPDTWQWIKIGEIASLITKGTTPRGGNISYLDAGIGFLRAENVAGFDQLDKDNLKYIDEETHTGFLKRSILEANDILITIAGSLGRTAIVREEDLPLNANQAVSMIRLADPDAINLTYVVYALNSPELQRYLTKQKKVTAIPNLTLEIIENCLLPLPPLSEQHRIVAKIEELLPYVDRYAAAYEKLEQFNAKFPEDMKKSILQYAIQGKLVEQRPEEGTGEELYRQIQAEKHRLIKEGKIKKEQPLADIAEDAIPFDIPESWKWVRWGNISQSIQYGYNAPAQDVGRIKMVRISDIQDGKVLWDTVPYCEIREEEIPTYLLQKNDILFARTGGTVGKSYLVKDVPEESIYAGYLIRTRYSSLLCPEYMKYFMESQLYWDQLRNGTIATAQPNCNGKTLSKMILPLPPQAEQKRIVAKLEEILPLCERLK